MDPIVGRDIEIEAVRAFLDASEVGVAQALIDGEAGIGKSAVWAAAIDDARTRSFLVLSARPAEVEADLAFSGLGDLLADVVAVTAPTLPAPQRFALEAALLLGPPDAGRPDPGSDGSPADRRAIALAVLGTLRVLAGERPVLVAVDDVQWLDDASSAALRYAVRRLATERIGVLLARRTAGPTQPETWIGTGDLRQVALRPMTLGAMHAMLQRRLGSALPRPVLRRIHELSRGNPLHALELGTALRSGTLHLDADVTVSGDLERLLGARIAVLPSDTRRALSAAAVLRAPTLPIVGVAAAVPDAGAALDPAVRNGTIVVSRDEIRFTHPLFASAAAAVLGASERRALHRRLGALLPDVDERARHLALGAEGPDPGVAEAADQAARAVAGRGAPAAAADLLALARRLTPPVDGDAARRRSMAEAEYRFEAGDTAAATELLDRLIATTGRGPARAAMLARQARFRHFGADVAGGVALLEAAIGEVGDEDALRAEIHEGLAWGLLLMRHDLPAAADHARAALEIVARSGTRAALGEVLAALALTEFACGRGDRDTIARALAIEPEMLHLRVLRHPSFADGYMRSCADDLAGAEAVFARLTARAERAGDDSAMPAILNHRSVVAALRGDFPTSLGHADEAAQLAEQSGQLPSQAAALGRRAFAEARLGLFDQARADAERSLALACPDGLHPDDPAPALARGGEVAVSVLGLVALATYRPEEADRHLGPLGRCLLDAGIREPGELRFLGDEVEALVRLGQVGEAAALVERLESMAGCLARPSALAVAAAARGLVEAASGSVGASLASLDHAIAVYDALPLPFERARALLSAGRIRRRNKLRGRARVDLELAARGFGAIGAEGWVEIATDELRRIGGQAPSTRLTPTEERVARLVAAGRSNKEAGAALVVTTKAIEATLTRVYAKLGIASRTELVRWVLAHDAARSEENGSARRAAGGGVGSPAGTM